MFSLFFIVGGFSLAFIPWSIIEIIGIHILVFDIWGALFLLISFVSNKIKIKRQFYEIYLVYIVISISVFISFLSFDSNYQFLTVALRTIFYFFLIYNFISYLDYLSKFITGALIGQTLISIYLIQIFMSNGFSINFSNITNYRYNVNFSSIGANTNFINTGSIIFCYSLFLYSLICSSAKININKFQYLDVNLFYFFCILIIFAGVITTSSRVGIITLSIIFSMYIFFKYSIFIKKKTLTALLLLILISIFILYKIENILIIKKVFFDLVSSINMSDISVSKRFMRQQNVFNLIFDKPFLGHGFNQSVIQSYKFGGDSHSFLLNNFYDYGLFLGSIMYIYIIKKTLLSLNYFKILQLFIFIAFFVIDLSYLSDARIIFCILLPTFLTIIISNNKNE